MVYMKDNSQREELNEDGSKDGFLTTAQRHTLYCSLMSLTTLQSLFLSVEVIIPLYVANTHKTLGTSEVAMIMVFTEVAGFIFSPFVGAGLERFGRKNVILSGFLTLALGSGCLAMTDFIVDDTVYLIVSIICRFI